MKKIPTKTILKIILIIGIILIIIGYSYYKSKNFVIGPSIIIKSPQNGITVSRSLIEIRGTAKNISYISIDDRQIFTNEKGDFKNKLLLFPGYNIISIKARDIFNRTIQKTIELIYNAPVVENSTTTNTTTTPKYNAGQKQSNNASTTVIKDYSKLSN